MFKDSQYSQFIFTSRYARYIEKDHRRELWFETVKRYMDFIEDFLSEKYNFDLSLYREDLENSILNHEIMPSMRALMSAGPAAKKNHIALYNCLGGETLVTTLEYGIVPIRELVNLSVHVVDGDGNWTLSECKSYGYEDLYNINLASSGNGTFSIRATENHRWIDDSGEDVKTSDLQNGTRLANVRMPNRFNINENTSDYFKGVIHGIIYGDGTATYKGKGRSSKELFTDKICDSFVIRLCGQSKELIKYFEGYQRSYPKTYNGDPVVRINDAVFDLKSLPEDWVNDEYRLGFIRGWYAADGTVTTASHQVSIASTKKGMDWIYKFGPRYGFVPLNNNKYPEETNFGVRKEDLFRIEFDRRHLIQDDFILNYKKELFVPVTRRYGKVVSVEYSGYEEVFCFNVPTTHSFLLTKNILTRNCAFLPIDDVKSFDEEMAILMSGTGVGYSVETENIKHLPEIPEDFFESETTIIFDDSRLGWAKGYREFISLLLIGQIPKYDTSKLREAGARLKTMGGRSSGAGPLVELLEFTINTFKKAAGRRLSTLEAHDIACRVADIVVVGGVRRSALISLSDLNDDRMRDAKSGTWWKTHPYRRLANNSAVYEEKPNMGAFMKEWQSLYDSKSGERGIVSRKAIRRVIQNSNEFRERNFNNVARVRNFIDYVFGVNPCAEIILRPYQFCNLTSVQVYNDDTPDTLIRKIRLATILGTIQSCFTDFKYLKKKWKNNCEEERLLGVSLNGIYDNKFTNGESFNLGDDSEFKGFLESLKYEAIKTNIEMAKKIGIDSSVAITCVKPEGTSSALNGTSSGIHPAYSNYYIRYVRNDIKDPLTSFMIKEGFPYEIDAYDPKNEVCFKFPLKAGGNITRHNITAIKHLELWLKYQKYFCEHKPSVTISVKENEWLEVGAWVYKNFEWMSGVSFLPAEEGDTIYKQAPFTECDSKTYEDLLAIMPKYVDWMKLVEFEKEDSTTNTKELACSSSDGCFI